MPLSITVVPVAASLNSFAIFGHATTINPTATVPGLDVLSTGAGISKPTIRGLSGNRIAVFSQGVRIENQQWGDETASASTRTATARFRS
ncbi:MAG: hypothetical protein LBH06_08710 [Rikenellaceae bacterium]|nr:hypothetical protein [Rikenellaceae bacterium]